MPAHVTFHGFDNGADAPVRGLGRRRGASQSLAVSGAKANSNAAPSDGWFRVVATEVCRVEVGVSGAVHASDSTYLLANSEWVEPCREGQILSVVAPA